MAYEVRWTASALDQLAELFDYLAQSISESDALNYCDAFFPETAKLGRFPRMYAPALEYGEGVRRLSRADGRLLLYEVDDQAREVRVLALIGKGQQPRQIR